MPKLKLLSFSDLHFQLAKLTKITELLQNHQYDACLVCGDLTNFGDEQNAKEVLSLLGQEGNPPFYFIHGNCDTKDALAEYRKNSSYIHNQIIDLAGLQIAGYGDVPPTPFNTFNEQEETRIKQELSDLFGKVEKKAKVVLMTHAPAFGIQDIPSGDFHAGSTAILQVCQALQPFLVLSGHIHEASGVGVYDYSKKELVDTFSRVELATRKTFNMQPDQGFFANIAAAKLGQVMEIDLTDETISFTATCLD